MVVRRNDSPSKKSILALSLGIPLLFGSAHCTYPNIKMSGGQRAYICDDYSLNDRRVSLSGFDRDKDGNFELIVAEESSFGDDLHPVRVSLPLST